MSRAPRAPLPDCAQGVSPRLSPASLLFSCFPHATVLHWPVSGSPQAGLPILPLPWMRPRPLRTPPPQPQPRAPRSASLPIPTVASAVRNVLPTSPLPISTRTRSCQGAWPRPRGGRAGGRGSDTFLAGAGAPTRRPWWAPASGGGRVARLKLHFPGIRFQMRWEGARAPLPAGPLGLGAQPVS